MAEAPSARNRRSRPVLSWTLPVPGASPTSERRMPERDPYQAEVVRRVAARAPLGFRVFLACLFLSAFFEMLRFPERRAWMAGFALGFVVLVAVTWALV